MRKRIRAFIILIGSLVILGGGGYVALMIARGNTITPNGFQSTGTVRLAVSPATNFKVYLNERETAVSSNSTLDSVLPGTYTIRVQRDGYNSWQQQIDVAAGLVTDVSVQLFPGQLPPEQLTKTSITNHSFAASGRYVYYLVTTSAIGSNIGMWRHPLIVRNLPLIDESPTKLTNLVDSLKQEGQPAVSSMLPSPNDVRLLVKVGEKYYILDANRYNEPAATNQLVTSYPIDTISWLDDDRHLIIQSGNVLIDYNVETKATSLITYQAERKPLHTIVRSSVYYVLDTTLYKYSNGISTAVELPNITLPRGITALHSHSQTEQTLVASTANSLYYFDLEASTLTNLGNYRFVSLAPSGRNVLVHDAQTGYRSIEVIVRVSQNQVQLRTLTTALPKQITESSIVWSPNSAYFVYQADKKTQVFTADATGNNVSMVFVSNNLNGAVFGVPNDNTGIIVKLVDEKTDTGSRSNLYKLSLTPTN